MPRQSYSLNNYVGGASPAVLNANINNSTTTVVVSGTNSSWGTLGISGGFFLSLNYGTATEEKIWVPSGTYNWSSPPVTLTNVSRGVDNTSAQSLNIGYSVVPILTAIDLQEANTLVTKILGSGNLLITSGMAVLSTGAGITYGNVASSGGGGGGPSIASLSGPGLTTSPGFLVQSGGLTIEDNAGDGINITSSGIMNVTAASGVYISSWDNNVEIQTNTQGIQINSTGGGPIAIESVDGIVALYGTGGGGVVQLSTDLGNIQMDSSGNLDLQVGSFILNGDPNGDTITIISGSGITISGSNLTFANAVPFSLYTWVGNPNGNVVGRIGDVCVDTTTPGLWQSIAFPVDNDSNWVPISGIVTISGTGIPSLSGAGTITNPGTLTQNGGLTVIDNSNSGINITTSGYMNFATGSGFTITDNSLNGNTNISSIDSHLFINADGYLSIDSHTNGLQDMMITAQGGMKIDSQGGGPGTYPLTIIASNQNDLQLISSSENVVVSGVSIQIDATSTQSSDNPSTDNRINILAASGITISGSNLTFYPPLTISGGTSIHSLSGAGLTSSPGLLVQSGGLTIHDNLANNINITTSGYINLTASGHITISGSSLNFYPPLPVSSGFPKSLSGAGLTTSPGLLVQSGGFSVIDPNGNGINFTTSGTITISGQSLNFYPPIASLISGTGIASLSGPGVTSSPGGLVQSGSFSVIDSTTNGISFNTKGTFRATTSGNISLVSSGNITISGQSLTFYPPIAVGSGGSYLPLTGGTVGPLIVSGSLTVSGITVLSGTNTIYGGVTISGGSNTLYGNTVLSGSVSISGTVTSSGQVVVSNGSHLVFQTISGTIPVGGGVLFLSANSATPTINANLYSTVEITNQTTAITSMTTNLTGSPTAGNSLHISFTGTGTFAITWGLAFESSTVTLPTTTVGTNRLDVGLYWNDVTSKWRCVAVC